MGILMIAGIVAVLIVAFVLDSRSARNQQERLHEHDYNLPTFDYNARSERFAEFDSRELARSMSVMDSGYKS